jgi:hypothetical protein
MTEFINFIVNGSLSTTITLSTINVELIEKFVELRCRYELPSGWWREFGAGTPTVNAKELGQALFKKLYGHS